MADDLPYVDEHHTTIAAPRAEVWTALRRYVDRSLGVGSGNPLAIVLGTVPRSGFEVSREVAGHELSLSGRHRFSRYRLVFALADGAAGETVLTARSFAAFPGPHGRAYRALVIGTRAHVVAVNGMLRAVRRLTTQS
jgi:hypothetical protein